MSSSLLAGRYELHDLLGSGGTGRVYRALDTRLSREVAVKILRGDVLHDPTARARLRSEAQIAGGLHHHGIAQVYDYAEDREDEDHDPYIVMQFVEGRTLSQLLREHGPLEPETVTRILVDVADALAAAHARGIVHRDLKPANIIVTADERPVIVDFGIAASPDREPLTETGTIIGTAEYLSPEQARGRPAGPASDVYALGLVAHTCLTGQSPYRRENHVASAIAQIGEPLPPLPETVSPQLRQLIEAMAGKDPEDRPSAAEVATWSSLSPEGAELATDQSTRALPTVLEETETAALPAPARPGRRRVTVYAGIGAVVVALAALLLVPRGGDPAEVPDVVGMSASAAAARLEKAGLEHREVRTDDPAARKDVVVGQSPRAGADGADEVTLRVATGRVRVTESSVRGKTAATARARLEDLGLVVTTRLVTSDTTAGRVLGLDRSGRLPVGSTITMSVAQAPVVSTPAPTVTKQQAPKATKPPKPKGKGKGKGKG